MNLQAGTAPVHIQEELTGLAITIRGGVGRGTTALASFDAALRAASVANFNLLHLSSVIPPSSTVTRQGPGAMTVPSGEWGDRLYVVMAERRVEIPHEEAWAGVGWIQEEETGRGLFVEHMGHSRTQVESDIESSLIALCEGRPEFRRSEMHEEVRGTMCDHEPVCALVVAVYESEPWSGRVIDLR